MQFSYSAFAGLIYGGGEGTNHSFRGTTWVLKLVRVVAISRLATKGKVGFTAG